MEVGARGPVAMTNTRRVRPPSAEPEPSCKTMKCCLVVRHTPRAGRRRGAIAGQLDVSAFKGVSVGESLRNESKTSVAFETLVGKAVRHAARPSGNHPS